mgnify:CR=1 FL=1
MTAWRIHHRAETASTNLDARAGTHGDVYTADFQTAGRGRLDHKWLSPPGENLMMSVVLSVEGLSPEHVATLPLVIGLAVCRGLSPLLDAADPSRVGLSPTLGGIRGLSPALKWPNDVLVAGRKLAGILCERQGDQVIVGIGVNVNQREFPPEIAGKSTSLSRFLLSDGDCPQNGGGTVPMVRDAILAEIDHLYGTWREDGFAAVYPQIVAIDCLKGRELSVLQTDDDAEPICGLCGGIRSDGSLDVAGHPIYAGEAHVFGSFVPIAPPSAF